ncbi:virulence factor BrkB family protein [Veronia pacifica]|uniref:UPF0761 membrane protein A8L45_10405 n=1 Tax=Veronia pacifica TaxID=1080227 RepID=A0A1C3EJN1_9GAMM|nr:virulence factor BrkB family protein [Veronia pacifica]ODA33451.1 hypothetical protein A8L45_10405 [Veronia pacifica]
MIGVVIIQKEALHRWLQISLAFSHHLRLRLSHDRLTVNAGYMAYVTLLSLVPLLTVLLSALSAFPVYDGVAQAVQKFVITNFVPASGEVLETYLNQFVANAGKMTAIGVSFLFVVALTLISSIDKSLNYIWRVKQKRPLVVSFSIYWMVLTLGPILVGTSIAVSSYITSTVVFKNGVTDQLVPGLLRLLPFMLTTLAFLGLYTLVPNRPVRVIHALAGAIVGSLLFELGKKVFAVYLANFPSYQLIYGALAVIPILFFWVYISWCIVLLGAEITAALGEKSMWRPQHRQQSENKMDRVIDSMAEMGIGAKTNDCADSAGK